MKTQPNGKPLKSILVSFDEDEMEKFDDVKKVLGTKSGAGTLRAAILAMHAAVVACGAKDKDYTKLRNDKKFQPVLFSQMQLWGKK